MSFCRCSYSSLVTSKSCQLLVPSILVFLCNVKILKCCSLQANVRIHLQCTIHKVHLLPVSGVSDVASLLHLHSKSMFTLLFFSSRGIAIPEKSWSTRYDLVVTFSFSFSVFHICGIFIYFLLHLTMICVLWRCQVLHNRFVYVLLIYIMIVVSFECIALTAVLICSFDWRCLWLCNMYSLQFYWYWYGKEQGGEGDECE